MYFRKPIGTLLHARKSPVITLLAQMIVCTSTQVMDRRVIRPSYREHTLIKKRNHRTNQVSTYAQTADIFPVYKTQTS